MLTFLSLTAALSIICNMLQVALYLLAVKAFRKQYERYIHPSDHAEVKQNLELMISERNVYRRKAADASHASLETDHLVSKLEEELSQLKQGELSSLENVISCLQVRVEEITSESED